MLYRGLAVGAVTFSFLIGCAVPARAVTVWDPNDFSGTLDVRSVSVDVLANGKARFTIAFWNPVPAWILHHHIAQIDFGVERKRQDYEYGIFRNADGRMRMIWWASGGLARAPATRVDPFTYAATLWFDVTATSPAPTVMRGFSSRKFSCSHPRCYLTDHMLDDTSWVSV